MPPVGGARRPNAAWEPLLLRFAVAAGSPEAGPPSITEGGVTFDARHVAELELKEGVQRGR